MGKVRVGVKTMKNIRNCLLCSLVAVLLMGCAGILEDSEADDRRNVYAKLRALQIGMSESTIRTYFSRDNICDVDYLIGKSYKLTYYYIGYMTWSFRGRFPIEVCETVAIITCDYGEITSISY